MAASFGQWLRERRKALGLTQEDLSTRVNLSHETIRKFEADTRRPSRQVAELLADYFQVPPPERDAFLSFVRGQGAKQNAQDPPGPANAPWISIQKRPTNLPASLTRLIGREQQVSQVRDLILRDTTRLLTLTGPPGIGKTSLALQVSRELSDSFEDGTFFVALASVLDAEMVLPSIAETLGVKERVAGTLHRALQSSLGDKIVLLVLDNFEQVIEAGAAVAGLLVACPSLRVLVTSREALRVQGERQFPVPPLEVPSTEYRVSGDGPQLSTQLSALGTYSAVALFIDQARRVRSDFTLTQENGAAVAQICRHLDGLPLAIELAAARTKLHTPQAILERLRDGSRLLDSGVAVRNLPPRQQTLQNAIRWSYDLLEPGERTLFRRLGVFRGGATLIAAEAVCNATGDLPMDVLNGLESLLDKSLLVSHAGAGSDVRFSMLETIRQYALERLEEDDTGKSAEAELIKRLHTQYFLAMAEAAGLEPNIPHQKGWLDRLESEHDNLRAALRWTRESGEVDMALRLSVALWSFWRDRGHVREGRDELEAVLYVSEGVETADRARALYAAGRLASMQGDFVAQRRLCEQSLATARKLADDTASRQALHYALACMSIVADGDGDNALARQYCEERLAICRELGDGFGTGSALNHLGLIAMREGNYSLALRRFEESVEIMREIGFKDKIGLLYINMGDMAWVQGDYVAARSYYDQSLAIHKEFGMKSNIAESLHGLGHVSLQEGKYGQAMTYFTESLNLFREPELKQGVLACLAGISGVRSAQGHAEATARLSGALDALWGAVNLTTSPSHQLAYERSLAAVRAMLGEEAYEAARREGATMSMEKAVAYALEVAPKKQRTAKIIEESP